MLDNDIDLSTISSDGDTVIETTFIGKLNGNGKTITGSDKPIFGTIKYAYISDLTLENVDITSEENQVGALANEISYTNIENVTGNEIEITITGGAEEVGGLIGRLENSTIKNIHIMETNIVATSKVGGLIGISDTCQINESTANTNITSTGNSIGGLVGELTSTTIMNSYSLGSVKGNQDVGGLVGYAEECYIENCYSNVKLESNSSNSSGGFIGQATGGTILKNNIAFGNVKNAYKFDGRTSETIITANYQNNFEYGDSTGSSTLLRTEIDFTNKIEILDNTDVVSQSFYEDTLNWDTSIWDFTSVENGDLPKLKNSDTNVSTLIIEKIEISTLEDFVNINNQLDAIYVIKNDIDFSNYTGTTTAVIDGIFTGRIEGNNYTLKNLNNYSLFEYFRGKVCDLNIEDFSNSTLGTTSAKAVAAFTQESYGATFENMKFKNITLNGANNVATVSGMDGRSGANSIFDRIYIENANVKGTGVYISTFVGRKFGGSIKNCFVEGTIECYTTECGGILGASQEGLIVENVIADVDINRPWSTDSRNKNGGFIGNIYNSSSVTIKNALSMGNMTGFTESDIEIGVDKFTAATGNVDENVFVETCLSNCYEISDNSGISSITDTITSEQLKAVTLNSLNEDFFKNILCLDENIWDFSTVSTKGYPSIYYK